MEQVCSELGLSMSAAFTIFARKVGREKRIPFDVSVDPFYSESNIRHLEDIVQDIRDRKTLKRINALNADTILAIQEVQELKKDPNKKIYGSFSEVLEELDNDE